MIAHVKTRELIVFLRNASIRKYRSRWLEMIAEQAILMLLFPRGAPAVSTAGRGGGRLTACQVCG
jgi:hypothetical protein